MKARYRDEPEDLVNEIIELERRLSALERSPRISHSSIDAGALTIRGGDLIIEDENGVQVLRLFRSGDIGGNPEIRFTPLGGSSSHAVSIYAEDIVLDETPQTIGKFEVVDLGTLARDGGFMELSQTSAKVGYEDDDSGVEAYIQIGNLSGADGRIRIVGRWLNNFQFDTIDALLTGEFSLGAGFGSLVYSYLFTFASTIVPILGLLNSGGAISWAITAQSTTGFTVAWSGTAAKTVNIWAVRL